MCTVNEHEQILPRCGVNLLLVQIGAMFVPSPPPHSKPVLAFYDSPSRKVQTVRETALKCAVILAPHRCSKVDRQVQQNLEMQ